MADRKGREVLLGAEAKVLSLIAAVMTSEQWAELLKGPLELAVFQGDRGLAQKLVQAGAQTGGALHTAVVGGHVDVVNYLLDNRYFSTSAHDDLYGGTPLHVAAQKGRTEIVQLLMLKGADKDATSSGGWTPLFTAAFHGHVASALALLAGGADMSIRCDEYFSVLGVAAQRGHADIVRAAIEYGADVDAVDRKQRTALHLAARANKVEVIDALIEGGANIEARDVGGWTPLHGASNGLHLEALTALLLKHGANVNAQNIHLQTPLFYAAAKAGTRGAAEVVDVLLRTGADETIVDRHNEAAAQVVAVDLARADRLHEDVKRVRELLANAPTDKAWRRRGCLVLCRAHPDRVQLAQGSSGPPGGMSQWTRSSTPLQKPESNSCLESAGGAAVDEEISWANVVAKVIGLHEEDIFRTIVGYL